MNPLKKYCEYLGNKNLDALCGLFADEFVFDDRGGQDLGRPPFIVEGQEAYRKAMAAVFEAPGTWEVKFLGAAYGNAVFYDVRRGDTVLPCVGVCRTNAEGKITEFRVFVREPE